MKELLKQIKWETILRSLLYVVLGIVAVVIPETMVKTLGYLIGILLIAVGAVSIICYLLREAGQNYYRNDFGYGLVGIAVGVIFLNRVEWLISLLPLILGVMVLASGCGKLQEVIDMKRAGCDSWIVILIMAALNAAFGIVLIINPFKTALLLLQLVGVGLIFSGITDCVTLFYVKHKMKGYFDRLLKVDSTFTEVVDESRGGGKEKSERRETAGPTDKDKDKGVEQ